MLAYKETEQAWQRASIFPIPETQLKTSIQVLNRVIVEMRKTKMDIQKISLFEDPLEAIVQINKVEPPKTKPSWLQIASNSKNKPASTLRLKLNVFPAPNVQNLFLLKYETLPAGA